MAPSHTAIKARQLLHYAMVNGAFSDADKPLLKAVTHWGEIRTRGSSKETLLRRQRVKL
jgi:hypothetical protein